MKILVAVCIYDRFENLKRWVHAWRMCDKENAELVIVHNVDKLWKLHPFATYCKRNGVKYVKRKNVGFETGIIQDLILERLSVNHNWDALLFITDDTLPIKRDFIKHYRSEITKPEVGAACMQISGIWTPHIRTTGFCITKEVSRRIHWVHNPVTTKEQCYFFEHQGFEDTLMSQILKMDKRVIQLSNISESAMWDTHHTDLDRWQEWENEFPGYRSNQK